MTNKKLNIKTIRVISGFIALVSAVSFSDDLNTKDAEIYVDAERGASVVSLAKYELRQGLLCFGYYLNDSQVKTKRTLAEIFQEAVEGDTIVMGLSSNRLEYVYTFYDGDNRRHWLSKNTMALADNRELVFGEIEYYRYQDVTSSFTLYGAFLLPPNKNGEKIFIDGKPYVQGFQDDPEITRLSSLKNVEPRPSTAPESRDPRRFYIYLKDGSKAIAAKYSGTDDRFFDSGITWRKLNIDENEINGFGIIDDGAFPQSLCLPKSEVESISKKFFSSDNDPGFWSGFLSDICGGFTDPKRPVRSLLYKGVACVIIAVLTLLARWLINRCWDRFKRNKHV